MRIPNALKQCIAFVGLTNDRGKFIPYGTGFCVLWDVKTFGLPLIVTARHLIEGALAVPGNTVTVRVWQNDGFKTLSVEKARFWFHPNHDPDKQYIDVAVAFFDGVVPADPIAWIRKEDMATDEIIASLDIGIGDVVVMAGMLFSHFGETKNIPIFRIGNIAAMRDEPVPTDLGYMDAYLTELRSIGGLSGSPVFLNMGEPRPTAMRTAAPHTTKLHYLLGLVHGHYGIEYSGEMANVKTTAPAGEMNAGIGIVIPTSKIIETIEHPDAAQQMSDWADGVLASRGGRAD